MTWGGSLALGLPALVGAPWAASSVQPLVGTQFSNVYPPRLRFVVLDSGDKKRGQWVSHKRDLPADTHIAFGHGFVTPPHLIAVVVGADSGNTQGSNVAYLGDISPDLKTAIVKPPE